jgi:hypothetical protein
VTKSIEGPSTGARAWDVEFRVQGAHRGERVMARGRSLEEI